MSIARWWLQLGEIFVHVLAQHSERIGRVEVANKRAEEDFQEDIPLQSASSSESILHSKIVHYLFSLFFEFIQKLDSDGCRVVDVDYTKMQMEV